MDKIINTRENLQACEHYSFPDAESDFESMLHKFATVSEQTIANYIPKSSNASCESDPIPTWLLTICKDTLIQLRLSMHL